MGELAEDFNYMKEQKREHKQRATPDRMAYAINLLKENGHTYRQFEPGRLLINDNISLWVFTGWWSGKGVGSGRGIHNLITKLQQ